MRQSCQHSVTHIPIRIKHHITFDERQDCAGYLPTSIQRGQPERMLLVHILDCRDHRTISINKSLLSMEVLSTRSYPFSANTKRLSRTDKAKTQCYYPSRLQLESMLVRTPYSVFFAFTRIVTWMEKSCYKVDMQDTKATVKATVTEQEWRIDVEMSHMIHAKRYQDFLGTPLSPCREI